MIIKREFKIGLFTVVMIASAWAGIRFLSGVDIFSRSNDYYVEYKDIDGIKIASDVVIRGVKVGSVTDITFEPELSDNITLTLSIERRLRLPIDSHASISGSGMMSSKDILIELGKSNDYLENGDKIASIEGYDIMSRLTNDIDSFKGRLDTLTTNLNRALVNVNILLESNTTSLSVMIKNLEGISTSVNSLLITEQHNIERTLDGMANFSEGLSENRGAIDSILNNVNTLTTQLCQAEVSDKLSSNLHELELTLQAINDQSGSAGKIIYDDSIYNNLVSSSKSLDRLLTDLRENPKRYVHFSLFGSNEQKRDERDSIKLAKKSK